MRMPPRLDNYVCRLCSKISVDGARNGHFGPLFREEQSLELARKIADIADIEVTPGDGLPSHVCRSCIEQVDACHAFRQQCRNTDLHFRRYISGAYSTDTTLPSTSGYGNLPTTSGLDTNAGTSDRNAQPMEVNIVKQEIERVNPEHYVETREENNIKNKDESVAGPEGNFGNSTAVGKQPPAMFPNGPVWLTGGDTLHMRELLHNVSTWLAAGEAGAGGRWGRGCDTDSQEIKYRPPNVREMFDETSDRKRNADWTSESVPRPGAGVSYECYSANTDNVTKVKQEVVCEVAPPLVGNGKRCIPKKFRCELCGKALGSEGSLKVHRLNHSGARPFHCSVDGCTKSFSQYGNLQTHVRSHLGIKPYACKTCGATFVQLANLQSHERKHTGARPYSCPHCHDTFAHMSSLHSHVLWHHSERADFECNGCGKRFKSKFVLGKHVAKIHNGTQQ